MNYVIGVDQGGSGTRAVICDLRGSLLGAGNAPGACHTYDGMPAAMQATLNAVQTACRQASLYPGQALAFTGGFTGADWADEYNLLHAAVSELGLAERVTIVNDSIAALRGGTRRPFGAVLVAGTGANCAALALDGRQFIYHYYHEDDLQGGSALGRAALQAIFRAETGRPPQTSLTAPVLAHFALPDVDALLRALVEGRLAGKSIPALAPLVFATAESGDAAASQIITRFARGCAELLVNALRRLDLLELELDVVLSGGIFKSRSHLLLDPLAADLHQHTPLARLVHARYEPVVGAALLALDQLGIQLDASGKENLEKSAQALNLLRLPDGGTP